MAKNEKDPKPTKKDVVAALKKEAEKDEMTDAEKREFDARVLRKHREKS